MSRGRCWKAVLAASAAGLVMSACGGGGGQSGRDAANGDPVEGGSLAIAQMSEPRILDPAAMSNSMYGNSTVGNGLFGTLMINKSDGSVEYVLAESMETSDDGLTWELTLRDGLTFSDGSPMDAADVAFNWERIKDPALGSATKTTADYLDELDPNGQVLKFVLTEPIPQYATGIVESSMNWIAKPEALSAGQAEFDENPIGAGPFVLSSWTRGGKLVMKKNLEYFDPERPYLDELVVTANGDEGQRLQTLLSGGADAMVTNETPSWDKALDGGLKGISQGLNGGVGVGMNNALAPFDDPRAREAIAKALDLEAINEVVYAGEGEIPESFFTKDSPFYSGTPLTAQDPDRAQELFDELAAEGKPVEFTFTAHQATESRRLGEVVQAQLSSFGNVKADMEVLDFPAATAKVRNREYQMSNGGFSPAFGDPELFLYQILHSGSPGNSMSFSDAQMDEALEAGRLATGLEERKAAYKTVSERLSAMNPGLIYIRFLSGTVYHDYVGGLTQYGNSSTPVDRIWTTEN